MTPITRDVLELLHRVRRAGWQADFPAAETGLGACGVLALVYSGACTSRAGQADQEPGMTTASPDLPGGGHVEPPGGGQSDYLV